MPGIHICLLSDQLLPNLIPVLMEREHLEYVYLVTTPEMAKRESDKRMRRLLRKEKIANVRIRPKAPGTGIEKIRIFAEKLADEIEKSVFGGAGPLVLNATGGTKLMSMGFSEVFRRRFEGRVRIIYTDTRNQLIETLLPRQSTATPMKAVLCADNYLAAQAMTLISAESDDEHWRKKAESRRSVTEYLANNCEKLGSFFSLLNRAVHGADDKPGVLARDGKSLLQPDQELKKVPRGVGRGVANRLRDAGLFGWDGGKFIRVDSVEHARYIGGCWLEEYTWLVATDAGLQDVRCSAVGRWERESGPDAPANEFDLLAVHDNRLLLVECKTGGRQDKEQAVTMRLESLGRNAGGLFGSCLLVSAQKLASTMKSRCRSLGISLFQGEAIKSLPKHIERWRDTGELPSR